MTRRQVFAEMSLFLAAAVVGVVGVGEAFRGSFGWLFVIAAATMVLARQMARVEDRWPRRKRKQRLSSPCPPDRDATPARPKEH
jgi:hypothetical protein